MLAPIKQSLQLINLQIYDIDPWSCETKHASRRTLKTTDWLRQDLIYSNKKKTVIIKPLCAGF